MQHEYGVNSPWLHDREECHTKNRWGTAHNVSHRRKLRKPTGAYGVLANRQPAQGARYREVQHVTQTGALLAHQAAAAWSRLQSGAGTAHCVPSPGPRGWWGALDTEPERGTEELRALVAPAAPDFCREDYESLKPSAGQLRVARDFASARPDRRDSLPRRLRGDEVCVAAQGFAVARCSVDNDIKAGTVSG